MKPLTVSWTLLAVAGAILLQACAGARRPVPPPVARPKPSEKPATSESRRYPETLRSEPTDRIVRRARQLIDRPYRWGGDDPSGFDCSGFTSFTLAAAGIQLPRTTAGQALAGEWIAPDELRRGDLVFFGADRARPFHVGLVVSSPGQPLTMIHASTSKGVIETEILSNSYWLPRLQFGRRVIDD